MDAPVLDQLLERPPGNLALDRVEAGEDHRLGRVIDDHVDAADRFEGADVATLAADDAPLHFIVGKGHDGHRALQGMIGRAPLDRHEDDLLRFTVRRAGGFLLDLGNQLGGIDPRRSLDVRHQDAPGFLRAHAGDPLQLLVFLADQPLDFQPPFRQPPGLGGQVGFEFLQVAVLRLDDFDPLRQRRVPIAGLAFQGQELFSRGLRFLVEFLLGLEPLVLGLEGGRLPDDLGLAPRFLEDPLGPATRAGHLLLGRLLLHAPADGEGHGPHDDGHDQGQHDWIHLAHRSIPLRPDDRYAGKKIP
ncbi:MAG: Uncharacterized protein FD129_1835, partial [bacterium]